MSHLRVSAFEAARELVQYLSANQGVGEVDAVRQLRAGPITAAGLDYDAGLELLAICGPEPFCHPFDAMVRAVSAVLISRERPLWRLAVPKGRQWARDAMDPNSDQLLDRGHLWDLPPSGEAVTWWDSLAAEVRRETNAGMTELGRDGERLTLEEERRRLCAIGLIGYEPIWVALEDNSLGYDVQSWDTDASGGVQPLRIEVKAFSRGSAHFFLSRNEWQVAQSFGAEFRFDIWDLERGCPVYLTVSEVAAAVPDDKPNGLWQSLLVTL